MLIGIFVMIFTECLFDQILAVAQSRAVSNIILSNTNLCWYTRIDVWDCGKVHKKMK